MNNQVSRRESRPSLIEARPAMPPHGALVEVRTCSTGIVGATADGAGLSPPWMTTNGPSFTFDLVRPLLGRATRSRIISLEHGADDESGTPERSGWSWRVRMGAEPQDESRPSERAGWSWCVRTYVRASGDGRPSERNGWSWLASALGGSRGGWSWLPAGGAC